MEALVDKQRARTILDSAGVDVLIGASAENSFYLTGMRCLSQWIIRGKKTLFLGAITADGNVTVTGPAAEFDRAACDPPPVEQITTFDFVTIEPGEQSAWLPEDQRLAEIALAEGRPTSFWDAMSSAGLIDHLRIAVDDPDLVEPLKERSGGEVIDGRPLFDQLRMIKTKEEVFRLRRAVEIAEEAMARSMEAVVEGMTEAELGAIFEREVISAGGHPFLTVIGFATFGAYPNHAPGNHSLRRGDLIRWDVGAEFEGYVSDTARVGVFGEANSAQRERWNAVLAGQLAALDLVRPGVAAAEIYETGMRVARDSGLPQIRRKNLGHGIGIDMYEPPMIAPADPHTLEAGMVFNLEVPYFELGWGAVQVEDLLHVTPTGCETLTRLPRKLFEVGV